MTAPTEFNPQPGPRAGGGKTCPPRGARRCPRASAPRAGAQGAHPTSGQGACTARGPVKRTRRLERSAHVWGALTEEDAGAVPRGFPQPLVRVAGHPREERSGAAASCCSKALTQNENVEGKLHGLGSSVGSWCDAKAQPTSGEDR